DLRLHQPLEHLEEEILQRDRQRKDAVEEGRDRRQLLLEAAVLVGEIETRRFLEARQRAAFDLAGVDELVELPQRRAAVGRFQIVLGPEQALSTGLALAARDG